MTKLIIKLLEDLLNGFSVITNSTLLLLAKQPFAIEEEIKNYGVGFDKLFNMFITIGVSLIVIKFLIKGFEMYVLWSDGDADASPAQLVINFVKAMVIALTFTILYSFIVEIVIDVIDDILKQIGLLENIGIYGEDSISQILDRVGLNITALLGVLIFFVMATILEIKLIMLGLEMLVLRVGLPLACVGLMDADKGVFKTYMQKFTQIVFTIVVQITMTKLAFSVIVSGHVLWGLAIAWFAITVPDMIKEFVVFSSGGGITNNVYSVARLAEMTAGQFGFKGGMS